MCFFGSKLILRESTLYLGLPESPSNGEVVIFFYNKHLPGCMIKILEISSYGSTNVGNKRLSHKAQFFIFLLSMRVCVYIFSVSEACDFVISNVT